jgi:hypothetical protein
VCLERNRRNEEMGIKPIQVEIEPGQLAKLKALAEQRGVGVKPLIPERAVAELIRRRKGRR